MPGTIARAEPPRSAHRERRRDPQQTQGRLLKAAAEEFARHGFAGARVDRILKKAKANPRMLYHYFGGKSALYVAVLEQALGDLRREELQLDVQHLAPLDGLLQLFDFMNRHFEGHPQLVRLLANENLELARQMKTSARIREMSSPVLQNIDRLLAEGARHGTLREGLDPLRVYVLMVALSQFHISNLHTLSMIFDTDLSDADWRAARHADARRMLAAFLSPPPANRD